jgi:hypothetical protein
VHDEHDNEHAARQPTAARRYFKAVRAWHATPHLR